MFFISIYSVNLVIYYSFFIINQNSLTEEVCLKIVEDCNACCFLDKKMSENSTKNSSAENFNLNPVKIHINFSDNFSFPLSQNTNLYSEFLKFNFSQGYSQTTSPIPIV